MSDQSEVKAYTRWEDGLFVFPMEIGDDGRGLGTCVELMPFFRHVWSHLPPVADLGWDCFQLLENGRHRLRGCLLHSSATWHRTWH